MWQVRDERPSDHFAILELTLRAFASMTFSDHTEQDMIERLRQRGRLVLSKVVDHDGQIVGHVAFSRMLNGDEFTEWYALGPIAVEPAHQRKGVGSDLIKSCVEELRSSGALGIALVGDPAYYSRFGFTVSPEHVPPGEPAQYFQLLKFKDHAPVHALAFDPAFYGAT